LRRRGVEIKLQGDKLTWHPRRAITGLLRTALTMRADEVIELLRAEKETKSAGGGKTG
jgi:hypothetical protein